jgi:hypothetical protein
MMRWSAQGLKCSGDHGAALVALVESMYTVNWRHKNCCYQSIHQKQKFWHFEVHSLITTIHIFLSILEVVELSLPSLQPLSEASAQSADTQLYTMKKLIFYQPVYTSTNIKQSQFFLKRLPGSQSTTVNFHRLPRSSYSEITWGELQVKGTSKPWLPDPEDHSTWSRHLPRQLVEIGPWDGIMIDDRSESVEK